jgi:hypothetical protein
VHGAGEQEGHRLLVDVSRHPPGALLGRQVVGDDRLEGGRAVAGGVGPSGDGLGQGLVGDDLPDEGDGRRVEEQVGEPGEVVGDRALTGPSAELVEAPTEADELDVADLGDQVLTVGEHLVGESEGAAGLGREGAHGER